MAADGVLDVVTIGEALVRFSPPGTLRLEQADVWEVTPSGAEASAAASLARLGLSAGWISKLPEHPLARLVVGELNRHGVDTSRVVWAPVGRIGACYAERAAPPRPARVWYDRLRSAATTLADAEVDWAYLTGARLALITGVTPALCPRLRELTRRVAREVRAAGRLLALDVSYQAELWSPAEAAECLGEIIPLADLVFCDLADAERVFGLDGEPGAAAEALRSRYGVPTVVVTLEAEGALAAADRVYRPTRVPPTQMVDRAGVGAAFAAGFICGFLEAGVQRGLDMGSALVALAGTLVGEVAVVTRAEVEEVLASEDQEIRR